jgi:hypothetical protein
VRLRSGYAGERGDDGPRRGRGATPLGRRLWSVGPACRPQRTVLDDLPTPTDLKVAYDRRAISVPFPPVA